MLAVVLLRTSSALVLLANGAVLDSAWVSLRQKPMLNILRLKKYKCLGSQPLLCVNHDDA